MQWAKRVVKDKDQHYNRAPVGRQTWRYGDGHTIDTKWGERGGTALSNLSYMLGTATGAMEHARDVQIVKDIDSRSGVLLTIDWGDQVAKDD